MPSSGIFGEVNGDLGCLVMLLDVSGIWPAGIDVATCFMMDRMKGRSSDIALNASASSTPRGASRG